MSGFLGLLLQINLGILLTWPVAALVRRGVIGGGTPARAGLRAAQALLLFVLVAPPVVRAFPEYSLHTEKLRTASTRLLTTAREWTPPVRPIRTGIAVGADLLLGLFALGFVRHAGAVIRLRRRLRRLPIVRRHGRAVLRMADGAEPGFAARLGGEATIVLPLGLLMEREDLRIALRHEAEHHRQGDPLWVHLPALLRACFPWNPALSAWDRVLTELQELACDQAVLARRRISAQAYGRCLLRAAESAACSSAPHPVLAVGMGTRNTRPFLRRRIEMAIHPRIPTRLGLLLPRTGAVSAALVLLSGLAATRGHAESRHALTLEEARAIAGAGSEGAIPLEVNDLVLSCVNRTLGSPEKRQRFRDGLARMPRLRPMIERKLAAEELPPELAAVPLLESEYRPERVSAASYRAAGLWQFIASTARRYELEVSPEHDDRLDPSRSTDAALRYLKDLHLIFQDWRLALKSYNEGESHVLELIRHYHTRDAWELERRSTTESYLSSLMATLLLMRNPGLLEER